MRKEQDEESARSKASDVVPHARPTLPPSYSGSRVSSSSIIVHASTTFSHTPSCALSADQRPVSRVKLASFSAHIQAHIQSLAVSLVSSRTGPARHPSLHSLGSTCSHTSTARPARQSLEVAASTE
jgi:hypothetical protein